MEIYITEQAAIFFNSLLLGAVLGIIYDFFRITRLAFIMPPLLVLLEDLLFFLLSSIILFNYLLESNHGQIRYFIFIGVVLGWVLYYFSLGRLLIGISAKIIAIVRRVLGIIFSPFYWILNKLENGLKISGKYLAQKRDEAKIRLKTRIKLLYNKRNSTKPPKKGEQDEKSKRKRRKDKI